MAALRWDQPQESAGTIGAVVTAEDDNAARGIVLGITLSLLGFWLPLAAALVWRSSIR